MREISDTASGVNAVTWIQIIILATQVGVAIIFGLIAYFKIYRHRVIYSIKRIGIRAPSFEPSYPESETQNEIEGINRQLASGKYTILQIEYSGLN